MYYCRVVYVLFYRQRKRGGGSMDPQAPPPPLNLPLMTEDGWIRSLGQRPQLIVVELVDSICKDSPDI